MNSTSMQSMHSSAVAGRKAFSGTSIPSMSRTLPARHQARTVTPQALFTKNKTKNEVIFARRDRVADDDRENKNNCSARQRN